MSRDSSSALARAMPVLEDIDPQAAGAFLYGTAAPTRAPDDEPEYSLTGRRIYVCKDGRRVRRTTVLMQEDMARRVDVYAAQRGVDKVSIIHNALALFFAAFDAAGESAGGFSSVESTEENKPPFLQRYYLPAT